MERTFRKDDKFQIGQANFRNISLWDTDLSVHPGRGGWTTSEDGIGSL